MHAEGSVLLSIFVHRHISIMVCARACSCFSVPPLIMALYVRFSIHGHDAAALLSHNLCHLSKVSVQFYMRAKQVILCRQLENMNSHHPIYRLIFF